MPTDRPNYNVLIASYLEPEHVERIRSVDGRLNVMYEPELLRPPRYAADHKGRNISRSPDQEARWLQLLGKTDILFDLDQTHRQDLPDVAPNVRWLQFTSAGIGQFVKQMGYAGRMPDTVFTTARGVHAKPLAEFCLLTMLMFNKGLLRMVHDQERKHWERYAGTDLVGRTLVIVGVGTIGRKVARIGRAFGMTVIGVKRDAVGIDPATLNLHELYGPAQLGEALPRAEYLVLIAPHTPDTEKMIGAPELAALPRGAIVINIARGALVDEPALVEALRSGHLGGAALDVFAEEPLPAGSPLWDMPNVLVSPHSGSTSDRENGRLTNLFCENLRRFLAGEPLLNVLDLEKLY